jgi:hypothetical protein
MRITPAVQRKPSNLAGDRSRQADPALNHKAGGHCFFSGTGKLPSSGRGRGDADRLSGAVSECVDRSALITRLPCGVRPTMSSHVALEPAMIEVINGIEYDLADLSEITVIDVGSAQESDEDADEVPDGEFTVYVNVPPGSLQ